MLSKKQIILLLFLSPTISICMHKEFVRKPTKRKIDITELNTIGDYGSILEELSGRIRRCIGQIKTFEEYLLPKSQPTIFFQQTILANFLEKNRQLKEIPFYPIERKDEQKIIELYNLIFYTLQVNVKFLTQDELSSYAKRCAIDLKEKFKEIINLRENELSAHQEQLIYLMTKKN